LSQHRVHYQRVEFWALQTEGTGKISPLRIHKLESIGFGKSDLSERIPFGCCSHFFLQHADFDPMKTQWNAMFRRLVEYRNEHGDCHVTKGYRKDPELANCVYSIVLCSVEDDETMKQSCLTILLMSVIGVRNQRLEYVNIQKGSRKRLSAQRIEKLESIGFGEYG